MWQIGSLVLKEERYWCYSGWKLALLGYNTSKIAFFWERSGQCFLFPVLVSVSGGSPQSRPGLWVPPWELPWCIRLSRGVKIFHFILPKSTCCITQLEWLVKPNDLWATLVSTPEILLYCSAGRAPASGSPVSWTAPADCSAWFESLKPLLINLGKLCYLKWFYC